MAACLAKLTQEEQTEESNTPVMYRMHELVIECSSLLVITLMSNPSMYKDLQHCKFDEGTVCLDAQLPMDCCSVLVSSLQVVDCTGSATHMQDDFCCPSCPVFCMCCLLLAPQVFKPYVLHNTLPSPLVSLDTDICLCHTTWGLVHAV